MTFVQSSLERSSEEVMRSYIGQRVEQYSFDARPILVGTLTNIGRIGELYCFAGEGVWRLLHHTALVSLFATFGLGHLHE